MLTIRELKITLGARTLFENASFSVNYGDRVALVGANGTGKSTLFSIILKQREPDAGTVERAQDHRVRIALDRLYRIRMIEAAEGGP